MEENPLYRSDTLSQVKEILIIQKKTFKILKSFSTNNSFAKYTSKKLHPILSVSVFVHIIHSHLYKKNTDCNNTTIGCFKCYLNIWLRALWMTFW